MLKRLLVLTMVIGLAIGIVGCGGSNNNNYAVIYNKIPKINNTISKSVPGYTFNGFSLESKVYAADTVNTFDGTKWSDFAYAIKDYNNAVYTKIQLVTELQTEYNNRKSDPNYTPAPNGIYGNDMMSVTWIGSNNNTNPNYTALQYPIEIDASGKNSFYCFYFNPDTHQWAFVGSWNSGAYTDNIIYNEAGYTEIIADFKCQSSSNGSTIERKVQIYQVGDTELIHMVGLDGKLYYAAQYNNVSPYNTYGEIITDSLQAYFNDSGWQYDGGVARPDGYPDKTLLNNYSWMF